MKWSRFRQGPASNPEGSELEFLHRRIEPWGNWGAKTARAALELLIHWHEMEPSTAGTGKCRTAAGVTVARSYRGIVGSASEFCLLKLQLTPVVRTVNRPSG